MGGIRSGRDALDFLAAGASAVAVGTENFRDPAAAARVRDELEQLLVEAWRVAHGTTRAEPHTARTKSASNAGQK